MLPDDPVLQEGHEDRGCSEDDSEEQVLAERVGFSGLGHHYLHSLGVFPNNVPDELFSYPGLVLETLDQVVSIDLAAIVPGLAPDADLEGDAGLGSSVGEAEVVEAVALRGERAGDAVSVELCAHEWHEPLLELEQELPLGLEVDSDERVPG